MKQSVVSKLRYGPVAVMALAAAGAGPSARADAEAGKQIAQSVCAACHGADGNPAPGTPFPVLAQQTYRYLSLELRDFKEGRRDDAVMSPIAKQLSPEDIKNVSQYFAEQKYRNITFKADAARVERGARKSAETLCTMCHLGGFSGQNEIPRVAGQLPDYVIKQLRDFKARTRTNDAGNMTSVAQTLSDEDIIDLAHYIANLP